MLMNGYDDSGIIAHSRKTSFNSLLCSSFSEPPHSQLNISESLHNPNFYRSIIKTSEKFLLFIYSASCELLNPTFRSAAALHNQIFQGFIFKKSGAFLLFIYSGLGNSFRRARTSFNSPIGSDVFCANSASNF